MAPFLEFEGKNVEAAVKKACEELKISESQLKHNVVSFGASGIFGLVGVKKARIRVTLPEAAPAPETLAHLNDDDPDSRDKPEPSGTKDNDTDDDNLDRKQTGASCSEHIDLGRKVLQKIIDLITTGAEITVSEQSNKVLFSVQGGNSALLIGKHGQTLEAIQYIVSKVVNKHCENRIRVNIDVEGYLESRRASLIERAVRLAEKVKRTGKPATIGIMNGHDRRIVHVTLKADKAVTTKSIGENFYRKLVIFPTRLNPNKKKQNSVQA